MIMIIVCVFIFIFIFFKVDRNLMWLCMDVEIQWKLKCSDWFFLIFFSFFIFLFYEKDMLKFNRNGKYWLNFFIWKCMLEYNGKWDVEIELLLLLLLFIYLFIMEMGVGNPTENEISWVNFFMCAYWNSMESRIERLFFIFYFLMKCMLKVMKMHAFKRMWSIEWKK